MPTVIEPRVGSQSVTRSFAFLALGQAAERKMRLIGRRTLRIRKTQSWKWRPYLSLKDPHRGVGNSVGVRRLPVVMAFCPFSRQCSRWRMGGL